MQYELEKGRSHPLGATLMPDGVNFSVFSENARAVELLLFDAVDSPVPAQVIRLDAEEHKTFYYWHVFVKNAGVGLVYAYRVYGETDYSKGLRFDGHKVLVDPYARCVDTRLYKRAAAGLPGDNCSDAMRCLVADLENYDWEGDRTIHHPYRNTVIYEMHVGGFTKHPSSGIAAEKRGTYSALIEKIPYLKSLGITAVELLPVQQFDPFDAPEGLPNYWGYSPVCFFAPHQGYASDKDNPLAVLDEFRDMVKALHKANIEVIMDVVFNHSAEGGSEEGVMLSFKGFENKVYYTLDDTYNYLDYSGCGNTLNANHSIVRRMIKDSLHFWVEQMHIDGFRFDLASVMSRDSKGVPLKDPPILWNIESDPILAGTKIIAEAWDAAGLYQVGKFIGDRWAEWNGKYRDDLRRFFRGDDHTALDFRKRVEGSHDLFSAPGRNPNRSIHFVCCHDGFTMNDLVCYNEKHNLANLENNQDGSNENYSWNCGEEGETSDESIEKLRVKQIKNFFALTLLSQGTPMLLMGDEVRRSQQGNNNPYCQDNEISWFDWRKTETETEILTFVKSLINFSLRHQVLQEKKFWHTQNEDGIPRISWHGVKAYTPDFNDNSHFLAYMLTKTDCQENLYIAANAYWAPLSLALPDPLLEGHRCCWHLILNTQHTGENNFYPDQKAPKLTSQILEIPARTVVVLKAFPENIDKES